MRGSRILHHYAPSSSVDEATVKKWMGHEAKRLNSSIAITKRTVAALLDQREPQYQTRDGNMVTIDPASLAAIAEGFDAEERHTVKIPIDVIIDTSLENDAHLSVKPVARALRWLEGFGEAYRYREGKMHLPLPIALELVSKYRGLFQIVFLVF